MTKLIIGPENINGTIKGLVLEQAFTTLQDDPNLVKELMNIRSITPDAMRVNCWAVFFLDSPLGIMFWSGGMP